MSNVIKNGKGVAYTIEVIIAIGLLLAVVAFLFSAAPQISLKFDKQNTYNALSVLNADGALREGVIAENATKVRSLLDRYFDNYDFEICSAVCFGTAAQATVIEYYVSAFQDTYSPKKLRVFLFRD